MTSMKFWCDIYYLGLARLRACQLIACGRRHAVAQYPPPHMFDNWQCGITQRILENENLYVTWHALSRMSKLSVASYHHCCCAVLIMVSIQFESLL